MKKIIFFLLLACVFLNAKAYTNYNEALSVAQKVDKEVIFFITKETCPYCHTYLNDIIKNKSILNQINKKYVVVIIDLSKGHRVPGELKYYGTTPTTLIISKYGKIKSSFEGAISMSRLAQYIK